MYKYYVYAHSNEKYGVFYVGKGSEKRLYQTGNRNAFWKRVVQKYGYTASILESCCTEEDSYKSEQKWIAHYKALDQCAANFTLGGDGVRVTKRWWGDKISKSMLGKQMPSGPNSKSYKDFATKETLQSLYSAQKLSVVAISKLFNVSATTVCGRLKYHSIAIRPILERGKCIICTTNGKEFNSITEAAKTLGLHRENVRKVLAGKYKTTGGLVFKYKETA